MNDTTGRVCIYNTIFFLGNIGGRDPLELIFCQQTHCCILHICHSVEHARRSVRHLLYRICISLPQKNDSL